MASDAHGTAAAASHFVRVVATSAARSARRYSPPESALHADSPAFAGGRAAATNASQGAWPRGTGFGPGSATSRASATSPWRGSSGQTWAACAYVTASVCGSASFGQSFVWRASRSGCEAFASAVVHGS